METVTPAEAIRRTRTSDILSSVPPEENGVIIEEFFPFLSIHGGVISSTRVNISWMRLLVRIEFVKLKRGVFLSVSAEFQMLFYCCLC